MRDHRPVRGRRGRRDAGFTLIEVIVAFTISIVILIGVLGLFELNERIARVQTNMADMQQALRISQQEMVKLVRAAGRGPLPPRNPVDAGTGFTGRFLPTGVAVEITNNVPDPTIIAGETVEPGTDVLVVRGIFTTPLYQTSPAGGGTMTLTRDGSNNVINGSVTIPNLTPTGSIDQDLGPLQEAITRTTGGNPEAILLSGFANDLSYAVVELTGGIVNPASVTLFFDAIGGTRTDDYQDLMPGGEFPETLAAVRSVGIFEEYRYFVRQETEDDLRLAVARVFPNTTTAHPVGGVADVADNILDLQLALGIDVSLDDTLLDDGTGGDEWLFNSPDDDPTDNTWNETAADPSVGPPLFYLRLNTLARTDRPDNKYVDPPIQAIEDRDYSEPDDPANTFDSMLDRRRRRQLLVTVIDMRNLTV